MRSRMPLPFVAIVTLMALPALAADEFENAPINYSASTPLNCISKLQDRLDRGEFKAEASDEHGYLQAVLKALEVPVESQMLVYSKTSLQLRRISPQTPRAIYFNDDVYVGYCQSGDVLEISAVDPKLGTVFYTADQHADSLKFTRQVDNCLLCHSSSRTGSVPGHLVRSLFVDPSGQPIFSAGSRSVDHTTPIADRWGGWYVTGKHGSQTHQGNLVVRTREVPNRPENAKGQNVVSLADRLDVGRYLSPHSDIVALMVLEHQAYTHNLLTKANFAARQALDYEAVLNRTLKSPAGTRLESTTRRIQSAGNELVDALLFIDEAKITEPITGTSGYAEKFARRGPRDSHGRSLRDFDLEQRLFKYPCSYLIYSSAFDALPREMQDYVWQQLWNILTDGAAATNAPNGVSSKKYAHLSADDRAAIIAILRETKPGLPEYWKTTSAPR